VAHNKNQNKYRYTDDTLTISSSDTRKPMQGFALPPALLDNGTGKTNVVFDSAYDQASGVPTPVIVTGISYTNNSNISPTTQECNSQNKSPVGVHSLTLSCNDDKTNDSNTGVREYLITQCALDPSLDVRQNPHLSHDHIHYCPQTVMSGLQTPVLCAVHWVMGTTTDI
jgi:hypothetical protein